MTARIISVICMLISLAAAQVPSGYVSYWKFDSDLTDENGTNNGTIQGGDAVYTDGVWSKGVKLSSSALYVDVGKDASLDVTGSFSVGGWVYLTGSAGYQKIVDKSTWNSGFYIQQGGSWPGHWQFGFQGGAVAEDPGGIPDQMDSWAHVVAVYDGALMLLYCNGTLVDTATSAGMTLNTTSLKFGKVNAILDEMLFYTRALNSAEVQALMTATRDTTPPVISDIACQMREAYSADVTFRTDMTATAQVEYSLDTVLAAYKQLDGDTLHRVRINGLNAGTQFRYRIRAWNMQGYGSVSDWQTLNADPVPALQKMGIPKGPPVTRPTGLVWPAAVGDADVCLWGDDKLAAITMTIDDNCAGNHPWWVAVGETLDFKFTWFVVTGGVDGSNAAHNGTWTGWADMAAKGHAVQSHTETHANTTLHTNGGINWAEDYGRSRASIEDRIPGNMCLTVAFPGGGFTNEPDTAAVFFAAARGTYAVPNQATGINYKSTNASSGLNTTHVMSTLDETTTVYGKNYRRGWTCFLCHYINADNKQTVRDFLQFMKDREDSLWITTYPDLIKYAQSRDTHTLTVNDITADRIAFTLTDSMMDTLFNYPLTVKVRIENSWDTCIAMQGQYPAECSVVEHNGNKYALVKAIPDRGEVVLSTDGQTTDIKALANIRTFEHSNSERARLYRLNGEMVPAGMKPAPGVYLMYDGRKFTKKAVIE